MGFTTYVNRKPLKFTCGLFDFDWNLILGISGALWTNSIILIQFDQAGTKPSSI